MLTYADVCWRAQNVPDRFELEYVAPDGSKQRPVMIHRAIFGSVERFFGILVENYAGATYADVC
jgi:threonyl-tRNA synthetase